jgi:hypothetical protein
MSGELPAILAPSLKVFVFGIMKLPRFATFSMSLLVWHAVNHCYGVITCSLLSRSTGAKTVQLYELAHSTNRNSKVFAFSVDNQMRAASSSFIFEQNVQRKHGVYWIIDLIRTFQFLLTLLTYRCNQAS